jgi:hypothetical protein
MFPPVEERGPWNNQWELILVCTRTHRRQERPGISSQDTERAIKHCVPQVGSGRQLSASQFIALIADRGVLYSSSSHLYVIVTFFFSPNRKNIENLMQKIGYAPSFHFNMVQLCTRICRSNKSLLEILQCRAIRISYIKMLQA